MDEFRKQYEYFEEKRGYILLFIIMLVLIDIYQAPIYIVQTYNYIKNVPVLNIGFVILSGLYILLIPITALTCYKLKRNMILVSKTYLILRVVLITFCILLLFQHDIHLKSTGLYISSLFAPLAFELAFFIGWFLYFTKSKRCKELVNKRA